MRARILAIAVSTIVAAVPPGCSGGSSSRGGAVAITSPATLGSINPASGAAAGGTVVTLHGSNFDSATEVAFGGAASPRVSVISSVLATAVTPRGAAGSVAVAVRNGLGGVASLPGAFTYTATPLGAEIGDIAPAQGPPAGGATVTIRGWNLSGATTVSIGGSSAGSVAAATPSGPYPAALTCTVPAGAAGDADVEVNNPDGTRAILVNGYHYLGGPVVTGIAAGALDPAGGTPVVINGNGFNAPSGVLFGSTAATATLALTSQQVIAWAPAGSAGATVSITVTNPDGQSAVLSSAVSYATSVTSPTVSGINVANGPAAGGTAITLSGTGFAAGAAVWVGGGACTNVSVLSATQIAATSPRVPAATSGAQNVTVVNSDGGTGTLGAAFTFDAMTLTAPAGIVQDPDTVIDGNGTLHTVWNTPTGVGTNSDVWYSRSTDGGRTWSTAAVPAGCG